MSYVVSCPKLSKLHNFNNIINIFIKMDLSVPIGTIKDEGSNDFTEQNIYSCSFIIEDSLKQRPYNIKM